MVDMNILIEKFTGNFHHYSVYHSRQMTSRVDQPADHLNMTDCTDPY